ncbi:MAG: hypothetical protein JWM27_4754 [Gemmatimonadetes bacterium]|nr:hypothetical protein [Gemmatimonadota bacterium]
MRLITVDVGLQVTAAAAWDLSRCGPPLSLAYDPSGWVRVAKGFLSAASARGTGSDLTARCVRLSTWFADQLATDRYDLVVLEVPHKAGSYDRQRQRQRGKGSINAAAEAKHNQALGALRIAAGQAGVRVVDQRAAYGIFDKAQRHVYMERAFGKAGQAVPPKTNAHERDAMFLGLYFVARNPELITCP